ncbi:hypothetical protein TIFTF001_045900 [Ficus carica]|uniref:Uncharacterized protein n=1 Tax=Ficus carica TaxID=3494 RepID=A0AA87YW59_FICCA|nr:hypothetical protein TIFTF001_045900 [Ficus carica]
MWAPQFNFLHMVSIDYGLLLISIGRGLLFSKVQSQPHVEPLHSKPNLVYCAPSRLCGLCLTPALSTIHHPRAPPHRRPSAA